MSETNRLHQRTGTGALAYDEGLRKYMLGVYNYMALGIAGTALIALAFIQNPQWIATVGGLGFVPFIGVLAVGWFAPKVIFSGNRSMAFGAYALYVALWGVLIGPFVAATALGPQGAADVALAFFIAASIFMAMSLYGYTTKKDLSPMAKFLFMAGIGFLVLIVANFFIQSTGFSFLISAGVILYISAVTAYETQMIKNLYVEGASEQNERAAIFGAFALYGSFVTLFIHVLNLLGIMRD
jgi:FtsH-binding integral membrane protein